MTGKEFLSEWMSGASYIGAHTSGSTGAPKEIRLPRALVEGSALRTIRHFRLRERDRIHSCVAFDFIGGKMTAVRAAMADCLLTAENPSNRPGLQGEVIRMNSKGAAPDRNAPIALLSVVPSQIPWLIAHRHELPEVRNYLIGGSAIPESIRKEIVESGIEAWESYGMTEAASHVALRKVSRKETPFAFLPGVKGNAASDGTLQLTLTDSLGGEIHLATNDIVELSPDGRHFTILGRADNVINSGGKKFHPEAAEKIMSPHIRLPFLFTSREDPKWGEAIVLFVETNEKDTDILETLKSDIMMKLKANLEHWMLPKEILFVEKLPRTPNGKLKRMKLKLGQILAMTMILLASVSAGAVPQETETPAPSSATETEAPKESKTATNRPAGVPPVVRSTIGHSEKASDNSVRLTLEGKRLGYGSGENYDADIASPKSVHFSADGKKFYVNSLEGGKTVVYETATLRKLKTIRHSFPSGEGELWNSPSGYYPFTHYTGGEKKAFIGKPVESALTPDGRYLFVPYYRRTFDINAQDPSALAVIDTRSDEIVRMIETGPLPKMVAVSNDGKLLAVTHWGNNTVGLLDICDPDPAKWRHRQPITVGNKLNLNYSLTTPVNRDSGSGFLLRGTIFLPGDEYMLVSGMAGSVAVINVKEGKHIGWIPSLMSVRHIVMSKDRLYFSRNVAGDVISLPIESVMSSIRNGKPHSGLASFRPEGMRTVKVGGGARTLELSPSGKYIYVACNSASALYLVDAEKMKVLANIPIDSYPVGLDVSPDGAMVVVTSQGRKGFGGNAVNIVKAEYAVAEPAPQLTEPTPEESADSIAPAEEATPGEISEPGVDRILRIAIFALSGIVVILIAFIFIRRRGRK